jgi:hypothetical protein
LAFLNLTPVSVLSEEQNNRLFFWGVNGVFFACWQYFRKKSCEMVRFLHGLCVALAELLAFACGGLGMLSVFYAVRDGQDKCIERPRESLDYTTWLVADGLFLVFIGSVIFVAICATVCLYPHLYEFANFAPWFGACALMECVWYVTGTYCFFTQVNDTCRGTEIYEFGFVLFVVQSIATAIIVLIGLVVLLCVACAYAAR